MSTFRFVLIAVAFTTFANAQLALSEESDIAERVTIPLEDIIGPNIRALRKLEPDLLISRDTPEKWEKYSTPEGMAELQRKAEQSLVLPIERAMSKMPSGREATPLPGFVVRGEGRDALPGVYRVLVDGKKPHIEYPSDVALTAVFFVRPSLPVRIDRVERKGNDITIYYMLISHGQLNVPWHLSLIPLGKLPAGKYQVAMIRAADKESELNAKGFPPIEPGVEAKIVCKPFRFVVTD